MCWEVCAISRLCFVLCTVCALGHCWTHCGPGNSTVGTAAEVEESGQGMCTCLVPALLGWQLALLANLRKAKNAAAEILHYICECFEPVGMYTPAPNSLEQF